jgi:capsular polysaccharide biosynthesis protein
MPVFDRQQETIQKLSKVQRPMDRDDTRFASYVLHLWRRRYVILGATVLFMAIAAVYVQFIANPVYIASAQILVKQKTSLTDTDLAPFSPITFEAVVQNDELLKEVMNTFQARHNIHGMQLERFRKTIKLKTLVAEDTSVRRVYAHVMLLSIQGNSPDAAKELMDIWTSLIIGKYSSLVREQSVYILPYYKQKVAQIESELAQSEKELARIRWEMPNKIKELSDKENLLAPARVNYDFRGSERDLRRITGTRQDIALAVAELPELPKEGLNERLARVQIDIAKQETVAKSYTDALKGEPEMIEFLKSGNVATLLSLPATKITEKQIQDLLAGQNRQELLGLLKSSLEEARQDSLRGLEEKRAEEIALKQTMEQTRLDIARLQTEVAALQQQYENHQRTVEALNEKHRLARDWEAQVEIEADAAKFAQGDQIQGADLMLLAKAARPDFRTYPKKALSVLVAGAIGFLLGCLLVILNRYIKDAAAAIPSRH